jgi:N-methylhydantoinase A
MLLGVDVGGTFTDAVLIAGDAAIYTAKVPSTPADQAQGVLEAVRAVLARAGAAPGAVERFAHGMTVATNALLEGRGARTALIATEGFGDVVELGRQARPHLYRLCDAPPAPLVGAELRFEAPERMTPEGPLRALSREAAGALVERLARGDTVEPSDAGAQESLGAGTRESPDAASQAAAGTAPEAVAVALLHSYAHPEHERLLGELLAERLPGVHVSLSHELVGTFREYERAASTEVDAALSPLLGSYLRRLCADADAIGLARPAVMQSSGGLTDAAGAAAHAALTVLSGPAGGVRGAQLLAELAGERDVLCFDMGGTSCDVCLIHDGEVAETAAGVVAGRPLALAMLDIHTVGAGGGSIAWRDRGGALRVGPRSAGADPGPACYGRGGEHPTVTDANLLLGRLPAAASPADTPSSEDLPAETLPRVNPGRESGTGGRAGSLAGGLTLDREAAERAVARLAAELDLPVTRCAEGIVRVAEAEMLRALRVMSVQRGLDPRGFALLAFGGAGPLHAAALARGLGMRRILCPRASGVLCAFGLAAAAPRRDAARTVMLAGESLSAERLTQERAALLERACTDLAQTPARVAVSYELRYRGQSFELAVAEDEREPLDPDTLCESFAQAHERRYGYRDERAAVELVTIRACAWGATPEASKLGRLSVGARADDVDAGVANGAGWLTGELRYGEPRAEDPPTGETRSDESPRRESCRIVLDGRELEAECLRGELPPGTRVRGPAVCALGESTLLVPTGWEGEVDEFGTVRLLDREGAP